MDVTARRVALRVVSTEKEALLLWGLLLFGSLWAKAQVHSYGLWTASTYPFFGVAHENNAHVL